MPLDPRLLELLGDVRREGQVCPGLKSTSGPSVYVPVHMALEAAGLPADTRPFQDCRKSCVTDWCRHIPLIDVAKIAGNSPSVIDEHYHQVLPSSIDKLFDALAPNEPQPPAPTVRVEGENRVSRSGYPKPPTGLEPAT